MKKFLLIWLIWSSNIFAMAGDFDYLKPRKLSGYFYPTLGLRLVVFKSLDNGAVFGGFNKDNTGRTSIRKVKVADLDVGLKKGDIVYHIHLYDKTIRQYEIKEYVNVVLIHNPMKKDVIDQKYHWNEYNIILSDDPKEISDAAEKVGAFTQRNGFVYIGKDFNFSNAVFNKFKVKQFKGEKLPPPSSFWKTTELKEVRYISLLDNDFYLNKESLLLPRKSHKSIYAGWLIPNYYSHTQNYLELLVLNKTQYLLPLNPGPLKYNLEFLLIEPSRIYSLKGESGPEG